MLMRHLSLPLPLDTNSNDERNILSGAATIPVPYHLDESDSESIVSSIFFLLYFFGAFFIRSVFSLYSKYALMDVPVLIFSQIKLCSCNAQPV